MNLEKISNLTLNDLHEEILKCLECNLTIKSNNHVPGEGNKNAKIMLIGEAPGEEEDRQGKPFVGKAGKLLTRILESVNIKRDEVFITNVVKCRPPNNRDPAPEEIDTCLPYLLRQIEIIKPKIIITLGRISAYTLLSKKNFSITKEHGKIFKFSNQTMLIPIYHPSYLLRNPQKTPGSPKHQVWEVMKKIKAIYSSI